MKFQRFSNGLVHFKPFELHRVIAGFAMPKSKWLSIFGELLGMVRIFGFSMPFGSIGNGEQRRVMELLVERVIVAKDFVNVHFRADGIEQMVHDLSLIGTTTKKRKAK